MEQDKKNNYQLKFYAIFFFLISAALFLIAFLFSLDSKGEWYGRNDIAAIPCGFLGIIFLGISVAIFVKYKFRGSYANKSLPKTILAGVILLALCGFSLFLQPKPHLTFFNFSTGFVGLALIVAGFRYVKFKL